MWPSHSGHCMPLIVSWSFPEYWMKSFQGLTHSLFPSSSKSLLKIDQFLTIFFSFFLCSWLNHIMHTNILVFMVLEMFICFRQYPSRRQGFTGLIIFMLCYLIWLHVVRHFSGIWVYPILEVLNLPQRLIFFACSLLLTLILYLLGETLNRFIWRKELILIRSKRM